MAAGPVRQIVRMRQKRGATEFLLHPRADRPTVTPRQCNNMTPGKPNSTPGNMDLTLSSLLFDEPDCQGIIIRSSRLSLFHDNESLGFEQHMFCSISGSLSRPDGGAIAFRSARSVWCEENIPTLQTLPVNSCPSDNNIYIMYHGTDYAAAKKIIKNGFKPSKDGMLGKGVYVSKDMHKAMKYPLNTERKKVVLKIRVDVGRVKKIDHKNHPLQKTWHDVGYDTAWVPPHCGMNPSGQEENCIYDPKRITVIDIVIRFPPTLQNIQPNDPQDGRIYVMYHGTTLSAATNIMHYGFKQSEDGMLGRGVYVTRDVNKALRYPLGDKTDQVVLKLRVNVGKVLKIDRQYHPMQKTWHEYGYDTAWVPAGCGMVNSGLEEDCVWDPNRIKVVEIAYASPQSLPNLIVHLLRQMIFLAVERALH
ncbi:uncharacterized protein [Engystomops pustulosus]|uniref:uncharacterized protein n=1 Tax=Engystomops pustulosus TaxID=76066 RepID=UPI003AFA3C45